MEPFLMLYAVIVGRRILPYLDPYVDTKALIVIACAFFYMENPAKKNEANDRIHQNGMGQNARRQVPSPDTPSGRSNKEEATLLKPLSLIYAAIVGRRIRPYVDPYVDTQVLIIIACAFYCIDELTKDKAKGSNRLQHRSGTSRGRRGPAAPREQRVRRQLLPVNGTFRLRRAN